jgi:hypothetical protein
MAFAGVGGGGLCSCYGGRSGRIVADAVVVVTVNVCSNCVVLLIPNGPKNKSMQGEGEEDTEPNLHSSFPHAISRVDKRMASSKDEIFTLCSATACPKH